ncbi:hypothetical protein [uncultured Sulfitobacter sp.]|uniref:hypothetical protein n=1 Tax=uncultured Sulfitobacter sp. TaxID=191468 RepID=UPI0026313A17|nr:hypothetical protein [uncultured Sulfitobacter sp.]
MYAEQSALQCPSCGGMCYFSPVAQALECLSCGKVYNLDQPDDYLARDEFAHNKNVPDADPKSAPPQQTHQCRNCGGEVVFTGPALSENCPYCNGPVVLVPGDSGYKTMALIPFRVDAPFAKRLAQDWIDARICVPADLALTVEQGVVVGLYAPFWTFDSDEAVHYWANYVTYRNNKIRTRKTEGALDIMFDDLLMPASPHVTPLIRDGILHDFDPADLRPYRAGYLAGFAAEMHHQSVMEGLSANETDKDTLIRNHIKDEVNKTAVHGIRYLTDTTGIHYRRILLPVWILHYTYRAHAYRIVVSGIDGRTFGERPFSYRKMALFSAAVTACAMTVGMLLGAQAAF